MNPTDEQLLEENRRLREENRQLKARIVALEALILDLQERLNLNSKNSSKPPSTDQKPPHTLLKKGGAQEGHPGHFRALTTPQKVVESKPEKCSRCGCTHLRIDKPWIFQQIELPPLKMCITEYRCFRAVCQNCKHRHAAELPPGIEPSAFGPRLSAAITLLTGVYHLSKRKAKALLSTLFNTQISVGSVSNIEGRMTAGLQEAHEKIRKEVVKSPEIKCIDETRWRQEASNRTVWIISTKKGAYYSILPSRGRKALQEILRCKLKAPVITDRYAVYRFQRHQWCLAHLRRDFKCISERTGPDGPLGHQLLFELHDVFTIQKAGYEEKQRYQRLYYRRRRIEGLLQEAEVQGSPALQSLAGRLLDNYEKLWLFSHEEQVEPTNNLAERDLRPLVIWRKVNQQTWSDRGSRFMERIMSLALMLKRQGRDVLAFLTGIYAGRFNPALRPAVF